VIIAPGSSWLAVNRPASSILNLEQPMLSLQIIQSSNAIQVHIDEQGLALLVKAIENALVLPPRRGALQQELHKPKGCDIRSGCGTATSCDVVRPLAVGKVGRRQTASGSSRSPSLPLVRHRDGYTFWPRFRPPLPPRPPCQSRGWRATFPPLSPRLRTVVRDTRKIPRYLLDAAQGRCPRQRPCAASGGAPN
jgi:hypothetical protein